MTHTTTDAAEARALPVIQADRDAAGSLIPLCFGASAIWQSNVRAGYYDDGEIVQAFARHRLATAEAASGAGEREVFARQQADHWLDDMATPSLGAKHVSLMAMAENCIRYGMRLAASLPPATDPAMAEQPHKPDYEPAWREMYDALSWMHGCKALAGYAGWPLGKIATDLIDQAYPGLRDGTAATKEGDQAKYADMDMDERAVAMANDCAGDPWELLGYFREKLRQSEANAESAREAAVRFAQRRSGIDLAPELREAVCGVADDYQTSEQHHPNHVLVPLAKFEQLRAVAEELEARHD